LRETASSFKTVLYIFDVALLWFSEQYNPRHYLFTASLSRFKFYILLFQFQKLEYVQTALWWFPF